MDLKEAYQELEACARQLGFEVRREKGDFEGGLCRVGSERFIILNDRKPLANQVRVLAEALATLDVDGVYLKPAVRELLEHAKETRVESNV